MGEFTWLSITNSLLPFVTPVVTFLAGPPFGMKGAKKLINSQNSTITINGKPTNPA